MKAALLKEVPKEKDNADKDDAKKEDGKVPAKNQHDQRFCQNDLMPERFHSTPPKT